MAPSLVQLERLAQFFEENNIGIVDGNVRTAVARHKKKKKWQELTPILNSLDGATKDTKAWMKYWTDKKYALNKFMTQWEAGDHKRTDEQPIREIDKRFIAILKESALAEGDQKFGDPICVLQESEDPLSLDEEESEDVKKVLGVELFSPLPAGASQGNHRSHSSSRITSGHSGPRRNHRLRARRMPINQRKTDLQRLIALEEKRVKAEADNSASWEKAVKAINHLADTILTTGNKIAEAFQNR